MAGVRWRSALLRLVLWRDPVLLLIWLGIGLVLTALLATAMALTAAAVVAFGLVLVGIWVWLPTQVRPGPRKLARALDGIDTPRLHLRLAGVDDVDALMALVDDEVVEANGMDGVPTAEEWRRQLARPGPRTLLIQALVVLRSTGAVIGVVQSQARVSRPPACELGWWMGPAARGQGYATEAVAAAIAALHSRAHTKAVVMGTNQDNAAARRVMHKVGATEAATRALSLPNRTIVNSVWYVHRA